MLAIAAQGKQQANCQHQDATQMHYESASFDLAMTTFALHEKEHDSAYRIIKEMIRVTSSDGNILIVDYELSEKSSALSRALIYSIEWFAGGDHYRNFKSYIQKGGLPIFYRVPDSKRSNGTTSGKTALYCFCCKKSDLPQTVPLSVEAILSSGVKWAYNGAYSLRPKSRPQVPAQPLPVKICSNILHNVSAYSYTEQ